MWQEIKKIAGAVDFKIDPWGNEQKNLPLYSFDLTLNIQYLILPGNNAYYYFHDNIKKTHFIVQQSHEQPNKFIWVAELRKAPIIITNVSFS